MFNRDKLPAMPNPFGSRPDGSPRPPRNDGYGRPNQQPPLRQGGYDARMSGGYDDQPNYGGQPPQRTPMGRSPPAAMAGGNNARAMQLRPIKSPGGNAYAFGNL